MKKRNWFACAVGVLSSFTLVMASGPVSATTIVATQTGTIWDSAGSDSTVFGVTGGTLDGLTYTAIATYDTALGAPHFVVGGDGVLGGTLYDGSIYAGPSPVSATLTINGVTISFDGFYSGEADSSNDPALGGVFQDSFDYSYVDQYNNTSKDIKLYTVGNGQLFPNSIATPPSGNVCLISVICDGHFNIYQVQNGVVVQAAGMFAATSYTFAAVPEPKTWAMMLVGLGGLGVVLRSRRRQSLAVV